jgi:hypothetical protein
MGNGGDSLQRVAAWMVGILILAAPSMAGAAEIDSKIQIHGFLSQAYARTDGEQYLGITEDGTTDYRNIALQFRFQIADRQSLVFQLGHESRGESPIDAFRDDVEMDWAFYEAQLENMTFRVGRIPLPLGIYSELRDAGHLLPFYGPPVTIYGETSYASESIDGAGATFFLFRDSPWSVDVDLFAGQSTFSEKGRTGIAKFSDTSDDWGVRVWLNTPVEGLRLGYNHHSFKPEGSIVLRNDVAQTFDYLSFDWTRERWLVRSEVGTGEFALPFLKANVDLGYVTLGYSPLPKFWVYLESERRNVAVRPQVAPDRTSHKSVGISLTYSINDRTVLKLEHQHVHSTDMDRLLNPIEVPEVDATIASISVAF